MIVEAQARVLHANPAAEAMLRMRDGLASIGGRLCAMRPADDAALRRALGEAAGNGGSTRAIARVRPRSVRRDGAAGGGQASLGGGSVEHGPGAGRAGLRGGSRPWSVHHRGPYALRRARCAGTCSGRSRRPAPPGKPSLPASSSVSAPCVQYPADSDCQRRLNTGSPALSMQMVAVSGSCGVQDAGAQEVEAGAAVHGPPIGLDAVHLSLDGACCPGQVEGGLHGLLVAAQAGGEPGKQGVGSSGRILQRFAASLVQQAVQALRHPNRFGQLGRVGEQPRDEPAFIIGEPVRSAIGRRPTPARARADRRRAEPVPACPRDPVRTAP